MSEPFALPLDAFIAATSDTPAALLGSDEDCILPAGGLMILAGKPGVGKTTLALDLAFHAASGIEWLDLEVRRPLRVLVIENEGPREPFRRKLEAKRAAWPHPVAGAVFVHTLEWGSLNLTRPGSRQALRDFLDAEEIDLVIADPLGGLGVQGVGSPAETREFVSLLHEVGLLDRRAFVLLHHFRKGDSDDDLDALSGAWAGHADAIAVLKDAGSGRVRLGFPKLRWAARPYPTLTLRRLRDSASFEVVASEEREPDAELVDRLAAYLDAHPTASANEVWRAEGGRKADVLKVVRRLREASETATLPETFADAPSGSEGGGNRQGTGIPEDVPSPLSPNRASASGRGSPSAVPDRFPFPLRGTGSGTASGTGPEPPREPVDGGARNGVPLIGEPGYLERVFRAFEDGQLTESEWRVAEHAHRLVAARQRELG